MTYSLRLWVSLGVVFAAIALMAGTAFAQGKSGTSKPGWGVGDQNHTHVGPSGQSTRIGPPGQSVRPAK